MIIIHFSTRFFLATLFAFIASSLAFQISKAKAASPFDSGGLSSELQESAETILLKAHNFDPDAIGLAIVGYKTGTEGFLQDDFLADYWYLFLSRIAAPPTRDALMMAYVYPLTDDKRATLMARYTVAMKDPWADEMKKVDLLDLAKKMEEATPANTAQHAEWKKKTEESEVFQQRWQHSRAAERKMMRALSQRKATTKERQALERMTWDKDELYINLFYAGTDENVENQSPPSFNAEKYFAFLHHNRHSISTLPSNDAEEFFKKRMLMDTDAIAATIRKAHAGDPEAMYEMSRNYASGDNAFIHDTRLSVQWLYLCSYRGAARCQVALAFELSNRDNYRDEAWAWAKFAEQSGDFPIASLARTIQNRIETDVSQEVLAEAQTIYEHLKARVHPVETRTVP